MIFWFFQVEPFLYNKGRGRYIPIANLVKLRNCDRPRHKQLPDIRVLENPEEDFDIDADCPDVRRQTTQSNEFP